MLKELFSNRLFMGALAFFILSVVGGMLYISHVEKQGLEELATDEDRVKQVTEKQQQQPTGKAPVGDTSQGGHFHEDGTWHGEPHEAQITPPDTAEVPTAPIKTQNASQVQQGSQQRMLPEDILSPEYITMVKKAVQTSIDLFDKRTEDGLTVPEYSIARNLVTEARGDAEHFRRLFYETGDETYLEKCYQIEALDDPYGEFIDARFPRSKMDSEQLSQLRQAADEFDAIASQITVGPKPRNPYREQLQEEENR